MQTKLVIAIGAGVCAVALGSAGVLYWNASEPEPVAPPALVPAPVETPVIQASVTREPTGGIDRAGEFDPEARFADFESRMSRFDTDGDGKLSDEERRAMAESMRAEWQARLDKNGDGVVDENERLDSMLESPRGRRLLEQFDADGDGKLDDAERQAALDDMAAREAEREARRIERYDTDGDGMLSEAEEAAARAEERARQQDRFNRFAAEFDQDGDGDLNADERYDAFQTMRDRREYDAFVRRYDADGDGSITTADFNAFLTGYQSQSPSADVNRDGAIDALDVTAFRDMMARGARP